MCVEDKVNLLHVSNERALNGGHTEIVKADVADLDNIA
jgi:hypothetical protein